MARKIQVEDLLAFQLVGDVQMSPAGDRVAYVVSRADKEKNEYRTAIWLGHPEQKPARFTGGDNDTAPRFSPDGAHLAFISRRSGQPQIWLMSISGGEARQLTKVQGGVGEFAWAPDSSRIAFIANLKEDGIQPEVKEDQEKDLLKKYTKSVKVITEAWHKLDGVGYLGERRTCLCVTSLEDEASPVQLTRPPYMVSDLEWTPDGQTILFASRLGDDYDREAFERQVYAIAADGSGEARMVTPKELSSGAPRVSPDGSTLAFIATKPEDFGYGNASLYLMPLAGGPATRMARELDRPLGNCGITDMPAPGGGSIRWSLDGKSIFALASFEGTTQIIQIDPATGVTRLTSGDRLIYSYSLDGRCRKAVFAAGDPLNPGDVYTLDLKEGLESRYTSVNEKLLGELELSEPRRFYANAPGGPRVDGWVMKPAGFEEGKKYPTVLFIHGGPMAMYAASFFFEFQLHAAQGFGVIYSNPRGSLGYGESFCMAIQEEWGERDYADLMAITDQAITENAWIDADRLGVTGGSYGGFMTNWIVGHTDRFKAAVTGRSICDWSMMIYTGDGGPSWMRRFGGKPPWVDDTRYKQQSPITYVENVKTPILIEQQEGDLRCPIDQGMAWYTAIKYLGKAPVRFVTYPGEFHGMSRNGKPWNRIHRLNEITAWFERYLQAK